MKTPDVKNTRPNEEKDSHGTSKNNPVSNQNNQNNQNNQSNPNMPNPGKNPAEPGKQPWENPDHTSPEKKRPETYAGNDQEKKGREIPGDTSKTDYPDRDQANRNADIEGKNMNQDIENSSNQEDSNSNPQDTNK